MCPQIASQTTPSRVAQSPRWHRLIRWLAMPDACATRQDRQVIVSGRKAGVSLKIGTASFEDVQTALSQGAVVALPGRSDHYQISPAGRALARRLDAGSDTAFAMQHREIAVVSQGTGAAPLLRNDAESPLLWLHRRKGRGGTALIGDAEFAAGERLRADLTLAQMQPRMGVDWSRPGVDSSPGQGLHASEAMTMARSRADKALAAVGPDFSGLLLDLCFFLKGLDAIERERGWPARSAKVVIVIALRQLARHYGLDNVAEGRTGQRTPRFWGTPDYRPEFVVPQDEADGEG